MAWTVRPDGAVDFVNKRWLDYAGLSLEEEIEQPTRVIHPEVRWPPELRQTVKTLFAVG